MSSPASTDAAAPGHVPGAAARVVASLVLKRLCWGLLTVLLAAFLVFALIDVAPGDAASRIAGDDATEEVVEQVRTELGLDRPLPVRFAQWAGDAIQGDLGESLLTKQPVTEMIGQSMPPTLALIAVAVVMSFLLSLAAGIICAVRPDGWIDKLVTTLTSIGLAVPTFWLGLMLVVVFALNLGWLPALGYVPFAQSPVEWLSHLVLPAFTLTGLTAAELTRQLRSSLRETLTEPYIRSAHMKGLSTRRIIGKHALKNSAVPMVTVLGLRIAQMLGGTVVVEKVFGINGMGAQVIDAVHNRDLQLVVGLVVVFTVLVVLINVLVDISYSYFDPRTR